MFKNGIVCVSLCDCISPQLNHILTQSFSSIVERNFRLLSIFSRHYYEQKSLCVYYGERFPNDSSRVRWWSYWTDHHQRLELSPVFHFWAFQDWSCFYLRWPNCPTEFCNWDLSKFERGLDLWFRRIRVVLLVFAIADQQTNESYLTNWANFSNRWVNQSKTIEIQIHNGKKKRVEIKYLRWGVSWLMRRNPPFFTSHVTVSQFGNVFSSSSSSIEMYQESPIPVPFAIISIFPCLSLSFSFSLSLSLSLSLSPSL